MASSAHPNTFPARPFTTSTYTPATSKLPDRSAALGFGGSSLSHTARENARLERERNAAAVATQQQHQQGQNQALSQGQGGAGGGGGGAIQPGAMSQLTDEQRDEINEAFGLFDLDKDSRIDYHEFKVALKALGFDLSKPDLLSLLTENGTPPLSLQAQAQHGQQVPVSRLQLTLPAFQSIASELIARRDPRDEILRAFSLFDSEGKGMITLDDLRRVARELGEGLEEEELMAMIEEFDLDGKGGVGQEEFVGICMG